MFYLTALKLQIMKLNLTFLFAFGLLTFIACGDPEEPDPVACVTTDLTYTADIADIINESCATVGCHGMGTTTTFEMHDYTTTKAAVDYDRIIGAINHDADFSPMPYPEGAAKLEQCKIDQITAWITAGAIE